MPFCGNCGNKVNDNQAVCLKCGCAINQAFAAKSSSNGTHNKIVAALLALFIGGLEAHKFYLGKPVEGIFYLLFCWTFIPCLIAFVEGIIYLVMSDEAFVAKYN